MREYDLKLHLLARHGQAEEELDQLLADSEEQEALSGGRFWNFTSQGQELFPDPDGMDWQGPMFQTEPDETEQLENAHFQDGFIIPTSTAGPEEALIDPVLRYLQDGV